MSAWVCWPTGGVTSPADEARLPAIGVALSRAYLPDAGLRDLVTLARAKH